jgi:gliding motility-associated-like protein
MKNLYFLLLCYVLGVSGNLNAQCPSYSSTVTSGAACGNQNYSFELANTNCPANIFFTVTGNSGTQGAQISWIIVNAGTGDTVAIGSGYGNNNVINVSVGPLNRANGTAFTLYIYDSGNNGFTGSGSLQVLDYAGNVIVNPFNSTNFTGDVTNQGFSAPINVPPVYVSITSSQGTTLDTVRACANINKNFTFANTNYCSTRTESISWNVLCSTDNSVLSSGSTNVTVYPRLPSAASDLVNILWDTDSCKWDLTPQNDCIASAIGSIFTISPDPDTTTYAPGSIGSQNFTVSYVGIPAGPDCCSSGGIPTQATFTQTATKSDAVPRNSPFGGTNNSAYVTVGPAGVGGTAQSGSFTVSVTGYSYPQRPFGGSIILCTQGAADYWVTVYVDGVAVFDSMFAATASPTLTFTLAQLAAKGVNFTSNSIIEVYVYPNIFQGFPTNGCTGTQNSVTTYVPGTPSARGQWTLGSVDISNTNFVFNTVVTSPANCDFATSASHCCAVADAGPDQTTTCTVNPNGVNIGTAAQTGFTYGWTPGIGLSDSTIANPIANPTTTTTYILEVSGGGSCIRRDTVTITAIKSPPVSDAGSDATLNCNVTSVAIGTTSTSGYTYAWSPATGLSQNNVSNPTATPTTTTVYTVTTTNTANSCFSTASVTVNLDTTPPNADAGPDQLLTCSITSVTLNGNNSIQTVSYAWSNSLGSSPSPSVSVPGTYTLTVTDLTNGCIAIDDVIVTLFNTPPSITILPPAELTCTVTTVTIEATSSTPNVSYAWSAGSTIATQDVSIPGPYTVTATDNNSGCTAAESVIVTSLSTIDFSLSSTNESCGLANGTATVNIVSGNGPYSYSWSNGGSTAAITNLISGQYFATVTDANGCANIRSVNVGQTLLAAKPDLGLDQTVCQGEVVVFRVSNGTYNSYRWQDGASTSVYNATEKGAYSVTVTDNNGCEASDTVLLQYRDDCSFELAFPTAFSPNGDGKNDVFKPVFLGAPSSFELRIFNRWGEKIFESRDVTVGWDGKFKGVDAPLETYVWTLTYVYGAGIQKSLTGNMTLLR